jgi:hypothetical protein
MSNNKSSIEWLAKSYVDLLTKLNNEEISLEEFEIQYIELLEQAKAMHKKEIKDAIFWGNIKGYDEHKRTWVFDEDEQYYNETFNPKEK